MTAIRKKGMLAGLIGAIAALALALAALYLPTAAHAENIASGTSGTCTWSIDANGHLTVRPTSGSEGTLGTWDSYNGVPWYGYRSQIASASFGGKVYAQTCYGMFYYCSSLSSIDLSGLDTSNVTDMIWMFSGCSSLTALNLSSFDTSNVTVMSWMFSGCSSLSSLNVSGLDTSNVTDMICMFSDCSSLTALNLSSFDTSNVTVMSWMFSGCSSLSSLNVSGFDTSKLTRMIGMFRDCSSLSSIDLSGLDTSNVTDMSYMFRGCSSLTALNLSSFDTSNVADMSYMFDHCSSLTALNLSSFDTSNVTDMSYMFYGCSALTALNLSSFDMSNVTDMKLMLYYCTSLSFLAVGADTTVAIANPAYKWYSTVDGVWYTTDEIYWRKGIADTYVKSNVESTAAMKDVSNATIMGYSAQNYTGNPVTFPNLKVKLAGQELQEGVDYTVSYSNNTQPGRAAITVTGTGSYTGSNTVHFNIWRPGDNSTNVKRTKVTFNVSFPQDGEKWTDMEIDWGFDLFDKSAATRAFDNRIAIASAVLASAAYDKSLAYRVLVEQLGLNAVDPDFGQYDGNDPNQPAYAMGYTRASVGGVDKNLYVVTIRGTNGGADWATNLESVGTAFDPPTNYVKGKFYDFVQKVRAEHPENADLENVVLVTGHSLGGAVAGRLTEMLNEDESFPKEKVFCYTFAAPKWLKFAWLQRDQPNTFNVISFDDCVPWQLASGVCRTGEDMAFWAQEVSGFESAFKAVTKGLSYSAHAFGTCLTNGGWNRVDRIFLRHQMDAYMAYLLSRSDADPIEEYKIVNKRISVRCPVDVTLVDADGAIAAEVVDNEVTASSIDVQVEVNGDEKFFYVFSEEPFDVRLTGTDSGVMSLSVEDIDDESQEVIASKSFDAVGLQNGKKMATSLSGESKVEDTRLFIVNDEGEKVSEVSTDGQEHPVGNGEAGGQEPPVENGQTDEQENPARNEQVGGQENSGAAAAPVASQAMHRLYNPNSGEHFYTADDAERDGLVALGWNSEGEGWTAPVSSATPVYRMYNPVAGEHHYTPDADERDMLVGAGWNDEGVGWYSDDEQRVPLYRDYNPNAFANNHNYTTSAAEHEMLMGVGWNSEGYAWYGM